MELSYTPGSDFLLRYLRVQVPMSEEGMPSPPLLVAVAVAAMTTSGRRHLAFPNDFDISHESKDTRLQDGWIQSSKASPERCTRPGPGLHPNPSPGHQCPELPFIKRPYTPDYAPTTYCSMSLKRHP
jgi:hypothetical protein